LSRGAGFRSLVSWPAVLVAGSIPLSYFLQAQVPDQESLWRSYGLVPREVTGGSWSGLLTSLTVHGGWIHAGVNGVLALVCGAIAARPFGRVLPRAAAFLVFYIVCGVAAGLAYVLANREAPTVVIGASGAVSGLYGAALRLWRWPDRGVAPVLSAAVVAGAAAFAVINVMLAPGAVVEGGSTPIAWQEHIAGFLAGVLLIGPWVRMFGLRPRGAESAHPAEPESASEPVFESGGEPRPLEDAPN
jgi:membrane associated rhomboid family serine protease